MPEKFYPVSYSPKNTQMPNFYPFIVTDAPLREQSDCELPSLSDLELSPPSPVDSLEQLVAAKQSNS
ncbi:MAG: hypothetical protein Q8L34_02010 [Candidatus Woesearchaeota archaeon]|nr:hypothetical protein [Candidatus Woesearchaeota archaeon]